MSIEFQTATVSYRGLTYVDYRGNSLDLRFDSGSISDLYLPTKETARSLLLQDQIKSIFGVNSLEQLDGRTCYVTYYDSLLKGVAAMENGPYVLLYQDECGLLTRKQLEIRFSSSKYSSSNL